MNKSYLYVILCVLGVVYTGFIYRETGDRWLYIIIFFFLAVICFIGASIYDQRKKVISDVRTYEDAERFHDTDGEFSYNSKGFVYKGKSIDWIDIEKVMVRKIYNSKDTYLIWFIETYTQSLNVLDSEIGLYKFIDQVFINLNIDDETIDWEWKEQFKDEQKLIYTKCHLN